jgi:PKD repeat protein
LYVDGSQQSPGRATLVNVTLADNTGGNSQLHVNNYGVVELKNTLMLNGTCTKTGGFATLTDNGNNLAFNALNCPGVNADPQLGPLQDNGGPTFTRAISATSPAKDQGSNTGCPAFDQRGIIRPQNTTCDIGAFEYNAVPVFTSVSPTTVCVGASSQVVTFAGSNFIDGPLGTRAKLNGIALPTTFIANTQLSAVVGAAELAAPPHTLTFTLETPTVDGGVSVASHTVAVDVCNDPIAGLKATSDAPTLLGNATQFTATITNGSGVAYVWDFGDGQLGSGANPTHTYASPGSYLAVVTATNNINRMVADTVVNVNVVTTGKLDSRLDSEFGAVITYTYVVTHIAPAGSSPASVVISGNVPANTSLLTHTNTIAIATGGDYGNGFVRTAQPVLLQPGQSYTITWVVRPNTIIGDVVNQTHASTDDGRLQVFERDRVWRVLLQIVLNGATP